MLRRLLAKLRGTPVPPVPVQKPAPAKSAPRASESASKPHSSSAPRAPRPAGERSDRGEPRPGGESKGAGSGERRSSGGHGRSGESRGHNSSGGSSHSRGGESRSGGGGGGGRHSSSRGSHSGRGGHGSSERERPKRDDFEHPRTESIKPTIPVDIPVMDTAFSKLGLSPALAYGVQEMGYLEPTPVQAQGIPVVLAGGDLIASAQTGTGKTAAFALPIIQRLGSHGKMRCLILEPTRELALQVEEAFQKFAKFTDLSVTIVYGGVGYGKQVDDLRRGVDILAATPGRLLDLIEQGNCRLDQIEILVLDEVDRMLDMGFLPDVKRIVERCSKTRQTLFFSATLPPEIEQLAGWALTNPAKIEIGRRRAPAETVSHGFYPVVAAQKFDLLQLLLEQTEFKSVIIFCRTRMGADRIAQRLKTSGHTVGVMHSDRSQRERVEALQGFKDGTFEVLVATDIAARGLDIAGVSHVVNYDVPENPEDYVHRIGRTGRAHASGDAFTLVTEEDVRDARSIERYIGSAIERKKIEGFPYVYSALFDEKTLAEATPKPASRLHRGVRR